MLPAQCPDQEMEYARTAAPARFALPAWSPVCMRTGRCAGMWIVTPTRMRSVLWRWVHLLRVWRAAGLTVWLVSGLLLLPLLLPWASQDVHADPAPGGAWLDDAPRTIGLPTPDWFEMSFLDLPEDLELALQKGKRGLAIYFGMDDCPYCEAMLERNLAQPDIRQYLSAHYDVVALDVQGARELVNFAGETQGERAFAVQNRLHFTPSMAFYDADGQEIFRIRGYYPPYRFRAALEYVIDRHDRTESFPAYLERADPPPKAQTEDINQRDFFQSPPHLLDRSRFAAQRPLIVFFERRACHACDILHSAPLQDPQILDLLRLFDVVQLDVEADTPVLTPAGERLRARQWAQALDIHWAPTLVLFDESGREILRIDSVVAHNRLRNVLQYVLTRGYQEYPTFERWRAAQALH
jgi:thioredoxin-related protein